MSAALISGLVRASIASQVLWGLAYFRRRHCIFQQIYKLWARSQWTKAIDGDAAAHERKSPQGVNRAGLCRLHFQAANPAQTGQVLMLMLTNGGEYATDFSSVQAIVEHCPAIVHQISQPLFIVRRDHGVPCVSPCTRRERLLGAQSIRGESTAHGW